MTLTSEKTATKRHAWLVGATTAAMAVALIGVGPVAANAAGTAGQLDFTVAAQSAATAELTAPAAITTSTIALEDAATNAVTYTAKVTTVVSGITVDATAGFGFAAALGDSTVSVSVADATKLPAGATNYTLTLTPNDFANAAVTGAVTQSFQVIGTNIYVAGSDANTTPVALVSPVVEATYGTVTTDGAGVATLAQNGATVVGVAAPAKGNVEYVPAGASYSVVASGDAPTDASAATSPFNTTTLTALPKFSGTASLSVSAAQNAPVTFGDAVVADWAAPKVSPFNDVTTSTQFYNEMSWLSATGISTGYADGGYHPAATIKRNAEAAFLYRLAGSPTVTAAQETTTYKAFSDVTSSTQFHDAIAWLYTSGITTGYSDGTFRPAAEVTRGAMAAFLYRFVNNNNTVFTDTTNTVVKPAAAPTGNYKSGTFSDVYGATQFSGEIAWLANEGNTAGITGNAGDVVTSGYADGSFRAGADIKRNAMAAFIYRLASI